MGLYTKYASQSRSAAGEPLYEEFSDDGDELAEDDEIVSSQKRVRPAAHKSASHKKRK